MSLGFLVDFDGTISKTDASYALLERFSDGDWFSIEKEALEGRMTILEALELQASMVKVGPEESAEYLRRNVSVREGFHQFADWCREKDIHLEICSDGFGHTIPVLLEHWGLNWIPWTSNETVPSETGMKISFPHHRDECPINGNCKCSHYRRLKRRFDTVVFIGDGTTDECVSRTADLVFARDKLLELCRRDGRECIPWEHWNEIREKAYELL